MSAPDDLPWDAWAREERERQAHAMTRQPRIVRASLNLPAPLVASVDRVAAVSGMSRHDFVAAAVTHYLAHWRPCPPGDTP